MSLPLSSGQSHKGRRREEGRELEEPVDGPVLVQVAGDGAAEVDGGGGVELRRTHRLAHACTDKLLWYSPFQRRPTANISLHFQDQQFATP